MASQLATELATALDRPDPSSHHDLWGYLRDPVLTRSVVSALASPYVDRATHVIGVETRGLGLGVLVAQSLGLPFVPVRKAGSYLPGTLFQASSPPDWEGKRVTFEVQQHALPRGAHVLVIDDWLTTGSQLAAIEQLVACTEATIVGVSTLVEEFENSSELRRRGIDALMNWSDARGTFVQSRFVDVSEKKPDPPAPAADGEKFALSDLANAIDRRSPTEYHDLWGIYRHPDLCRRVVRALSGEFSKEKPTHVVGVETRGLVLGPLIAQALELPFVPIRKSGRYLPGSIVTGETTPDWEGKISKLEMQQSALPQGSRALLVDDWCTTGSHILAAQVLLSKVESILIGAGVFAEEFRDGLPGNFPRLVSFLNWDEARGTLIPSKFRPGHSLV